MSAPGQALEAALQRSRARGRAEIVFFVNGYDPSPEVTLELLRVVRGHDLACVELCVPFPDSVTDGPVIRASHDRGLAAGSTLRGVLALAARARSELGLHVVLLADHRYTVAAVGLERFIRSAADAGVSATLIHALPPRLRASYVELSRAAGLGRVTTFFASSQPAVRRAAYDDAEGFVYVVSRLGRTGAAPLDDSLYDAITAFRGETTRPLAVGFGVSTPGHVMRLLRAGADAVIVGSAGIAVVADQLARRAEIAPAFDRLVTALLGDEPITPQGSTP
jgi:tryptophan synthase alpha chain